MFIIKVILSGLIILFLAIFQVVFPDPLRIAGLKPDLLLIAIIFFSLRRGALFGFGVGAFAGLLTDCFSRSVLGLNVFLLGMAGLLVGRIAGWFQPRNFLAQMFLVFVVSLAASVLHLFAARIAVSGTPFFPSLGRIILPASVYTALVSPLLFFVLFWISKPLKL